MTTEGPLAVDPPEPARWRSRAGGRAGTLLGRARRGARRRSDHPEPTPVIADRIDDGVLEIHLGAGERRNVLGRATLRRIESLVETPPDGTRVIVLTADPPDFCAGYDLVEAGRGEPESLIAHEENLSALRRSGVPIIAAIHGHVIGGGLELALAADVRIASPDARLSIPAARLGLVYSAAGVRLLVEELGDSTARAMFLAGRVISASEALSSGLVSEIVGREELRERALELARTMASWPHVATSGNRRVLDVVAGRVTDDAAALRIASFAPDGSLAASIDHFARRRAEAPVRPDRRLRRAAGRRAVASAARRIRGRLPRFGISARGRHARARR